MGHAARVKGIRNANRFWLDKVKESDRLEEVNLDEWAVCRRLAGLWTEFYLLQYRKPRWALVNAVVNNMIMESVLLNFSVKINIAANTVNSNGV